MKKNRLYLFSSLLILALFAFQSCEQYVITFPKEEVKYESYTTTIQPIFKSNCVGCHGIGANPELTEANSYASLTSGNYLNLDSPEESLIIETLRGSHKGYTSSSNINLILSWIEAGAPND